MREKITLCVIRTIGAVVLFVVFIFTVRWLEIDYEDAKVVLALINAYLPELVFLLMVSGGAFVFYRMSVDEENDFEFAKFFEAGSKYDIYRFGYFWLLIIAGWTVWVTAWRDKSIEALLGIVLAGFLAKAATDSIASAIGKPKDRGQ